MPSPHELNLVESVKDTISALAEKIGISNEDAALAFLTASLMEVERLYGTKNMSFIAAEIIKHGQGYHQCSAGGQVIPFPAKRK